MIYRSAFVIKPSNDGVFQKYLPQITIVSGLMCAILLAVGLWWITIVSVHASDEPVSFAPQHPDVNLGENPVKDKSAPVIETQNFPPKTPAISPIFTSEIQFWSSQIASWSQSYGLDPNLVATIMQIESCGYPYAISHAGAQGLFQVMPFHFDTGEDMLNPNTNAKRALDFLAQTLDLMEGNVGLTFAGYNGGPATSLKGWDNWPSETQDYYIWGTSIYSDATSGLSTSDNLSRWLNAGGDYLCQQASHYQASNG